MSRRVGRFFWKALAYILYKFHSSYSVPTGLGLCLTHLCNIECIYCMRWSFAPQPGPMTLERVKQLMKKMPFINNVCIMGLCEPFLNPATPEIVYWLSSQGYSLSLTTNGMVALTGDKLDCLRRVDDFVISIDTSDPDTFTYLRGGAKLDVVMQNFKRVIEMKRRLGLNKYDKPPLHINAVITTKNWAQIPGLIRMLEPYAEDLTYLMVDPVSRPDYSQFEEPLALKHDETFELQIADLRENAKQSPLRVLGLDYMLAPSLNWKDCPISWLDIWVEPNGDIYNCYAYDHIVGNVFIDDPLKAHNSPKARTFRKQLLSDDPPVQQCHSCNFARQHWQDGTYLREKKDIAYDT